MAVITHGDLEGPEAAECRHVVVAGAIGELLVCWEYGVVLHGRL